VGKVLLLGVKVSCIIMLHVDCGVREKHKLFRGKEKVRIGIKQDNGEKL
jgi:hypothetical protein